MPKIKVVLEERERKRLLAARRRPYLFSLGFTEEQVDILEHIPPKHPARRRVIREQKRRLREVMEIEGVSLPEAAEILRRYAKDKIEEWALMGYGGLPPDEDPIVMMGYVYG